MTRRRLHWLTILVLTGYTAISTGASFAIGGVTTHPSRELFPFFTWSLFSWVPDRRNLYVVEISRIGEDVFDPPVEMQHLPQFADGSTLAYKSVQDLGRAGGGDDAARATFEGRYLKGERVDYRIVRKRFVPLERWNTGAALSVEVIGEFTSGDGA